MNKSLGHVMLAGRLVSPRKTGTRSGTHEAIFSFSLRECGRGAKLPRDHTTEKILQYLRQTGNVVRHDLTEFIRPDDSAYEPPMQPLHGDY